MSDVTVIFTAIRFKLELFEFDRLKKANWYTLYSANSAMGGDV
jgi:hypothetical protein